MAGGKGGEMARGRLQRCVIAMLAALALAVAACGTQLSDEELVTADRLGGGGGGADDFALSTSDDPSAPSAGGAGASTKGGATSASAGAPTGGGTSGDPAAADGGGAPADAGGAGAEAPTPAEGNGGATDVGVTETTITVGTIATLTGPQPGLFRGAAQGAQACALRANSNGGLFGRTIQVKVGDDQANENQVRSLADSFAKEVFAFVGSFTLFDGAMAPALDAGVPDMGVTLQPGRNKHPNNFAPQPNAPGWQTGGLTYLKKKFPDAAQAVGFLGADLAPTQNEGIKAVLRELGYKIVYDQTYGATTQDFTAQVFRMRSDGVRFLIMTGDTASYARVLQAADQQGFELDVFNPISNAYDPKYLKLAGSLAEGTIIYATHALFLGEDSGTVPEVDEYRTWLSRIDPNATPDVFGLYGWTSCQMFVDAAREVGPNLTREALLAQLGTLTEYDARGLIAPNNPAEKRPPECYVMLQLKGSTWERLDTPPGGFRCDGSYLYL